MEITNGFITKYFGNTDPVYILLYIYLADQRKSDFSVEQVCDFLNITSNVLKNALDFWQRYEQFEYTLNGDLLHVNIKILLDNGRKETDVLDIVRLQKDDTFREIVDFIKMTFPIDVQDYPKIAYYYEEQHFTTDMFVLLLKYATDHRAKSLQYVFSVADTWIKSGVDTLEKAIDWVNGDYAIYYSLMRKCGQNRYPVDKERGLLNSLLVIYTEKELSDRIERYVMENPKATPSAIFETIKKQAPTF